MSSNLFYSSEAFFFFIIGGAIVANILLNTLNMSKEKKNRSSTFSLAYKKKKKVIASSGAMKLLVLSNKPSSAQNLVFTKRWFIIAFKCNVGTANTVLYPLPLPPNRLRSIRSPSPWTRFVPWLRNWIISAIEVMMWWYHVMFLSFYP